jgi:hypothetical protein
MELHKDFHKSQLWQLFVEINQADLFFLSERTILGFRTKAIHKTVSSLSYLITNSGQGGLFRSQHSRRLVVSYVVVQVVVFLLDDKLI